MDMIAIEQRRILWVNLAKKPIIPTSPFKVLTEGKTLCFFHLG